MPSESLAPAVFLDRDGTIIEDRHYLRHPEDVAVLPGAAEALRELRAAGYRLFIVSNQSGVGRGYFTMAEAEKVNERMLSDLGGNLFDHIYMAPEAPDQPSRGRKPSPQFLYDARDAHGVDLARSWMIGDKLIDLQCGWNAGLRGVILVRTGYGAQTEREDRARLGTAIVADTLKDAARHILG
jgi:D-glycero-D-manno-heptose 1,7-bisphosphate phosphatase